MAKKKTKSDAKKVVKLDAKPLQLSFKDNLKKKITYFKSADAFKFTRIDKDDEERLAGCLRSVEERIQTDEVMDDMKDRPAPVDEGTNAPVDSVTDKKLKLKRRMELIKKKFVFGFNEIAKKLKDHQIVGIIMASQLTNHVQRTVLELASNQKVAVLITTNIEFYQSFFKISRISCFALLFSVQSEASIFNEFGRTFLEISNQSGDLKQPLGAESAANEMPVDEDSLDEEERRAEPDLEEQKDQESHEKEKEPGQETSKQPPTIQRSSNKPKKLKINQIEIDRLLMPSRSPIDEASNASHRSVLSGDITNKRKFNKSDDLLLISGERGDDYFPVREYT